MTELTLRKRLIRALENSAEHLLVGLAQDPPPRLYAVDSGKAVDAILQELEAGQRDA